MINVGGYRATEEELEMLRDLADIEPDDSNLYGDFSNDPDYH